MRLERLRFALLGSVTFAIASLAVVAYVYTAANVIRLGRSSPNSGLSVASASTRDIKEVGMWIRRQQDRRVKIMDLETPLAFYADAEYVHFPYSNAETATRFLDAAKVDYVILRRAQTFTDYYDDWLNNGIPDPRAKLVYVSSGPNPGAFLVFKWLRNSEPPSAVQTPVPYKGSGITRSRRQTALFTWIHGTDDISWIVTIPTNESCTLLRRAGDADSGVPGASPQADDHDRLPAHPLARHEVLRSLRAQGLHPLPGLQGRRRQELFPELRRVRFQQLRPFQRREETPALELLKSDIHDWNITFVDTGISSNIGQRLKAVRPYLEGKYIFLANYSDGLTDLPLSEYIDCFFRRDKFGSFLAVSPSQSCHVASFNGDVVTAVHPIVRPFCGSTAASSSSARRYSGTRAMERNWWSSPSQADPGGAAHRLQIQRLLELHGHVQGAAAT